MKQGSWTERIAVVLQELQCQPAVQQRILLAVDQCPVAERSGVVWLRIFETCQATPSLWTPVRRVLEAALNVPLDHPAGINWLPGLSLMLGCSPYFADIVCANPPVLLDILESGSLDTPRDRAWYESQLHQLTAAPTFTTENSQILVHQWQRRELLRIGWRDYAGLVTPQTNARELSDLADAIIRWAVRHAWAEQVSRHGLPEGAPQATTEKGALLGTESTFIVVGMGKLGGRELNFSSDVDLVFLYEYEGQTQGRADGLGAISHHQFFNQLAERVSRILAERGPFGQLYRVDLRLRPEGALGPLSRSVESLVSYFGEQARDWERVSWLKARAITGANRLKDWFEEVVMGFVYSPIQPDQLFREVESLKQRIDAAIGGEAESGPCMDVKRGRGGIREIEFTVTVLQVLYGGRHKALRVRPLLKAVERLAEVGLISPEDRLRLEEHYGQLRRIEHRLQMEHGRQEHRLPNYGERRDLLAKSLGLDHGQSLTDLLDRLTSDVHAWYGQFFQADREASELEDRDVAILLSQTATDQDLQTVLNRRGLNLSSVRLLRSLAFGTSEVFVSAQGQRAFEQLLPSLLRLAAGRPRPDRVFIHLHSIMQRLQSASYYYEILAGHPGVLRMICFLFGTSDRLTEMLLAHPEFFDRLIMGSTLFQGDRETQAAGILTRLHQSLSQAPTLQARCRVLRRSAQFEILVAALGWLVNLASLEESLEQLSDSADLVLACALGLAAEGVAHRHGYSAEQTQQLQELVTDRLALMALGKYGSCEVNFFGDLDLIPVTFAEGLSRTQESLLEEVFKELLALMTNNDHSNRSWELDTRLRPWGKDGPLVPTDEEWLSYLTDSCQAWEMISYQRMRCCLGPQHRVRPFLKRVQERVRDQLQGRWTGGKFLEEVRAMRSRLEEAAQASHSNAIELKRSAGGLMDAEFALQSYLVLRNPDNSPVEPILNPTLSDSQKWRLLGEHGIGPAGLPDIMALGYNSLRLAENVCRIIHGSSISEIPDPSTEAELTRALWVNLDIVGIHSPDDLIYIKLKNRQAYNDWMDWLENQF